MRDFQESSCPIKDKNDSLDELLGPDTVTDTVISLCREEISTQLLGCLHTDVDVVLSPNSSYVIKNAFTRSPLVLFSVKVQLTNMITKQVPSINSAVLLLKSHSRHLTGKASIREREKDVVGRLFDCL